MNKIVNHKILNSDHLKIIAALCMVLDHIKYYFSDTCNIPVYFGWFGRIVLPVFVFMTVQGFIHTSNLRKYLLRLYLFFCGMSAVQLISQELALRSKPIESGHSMFGTIFVVLISLFLVGEIEKAIKDKNLKDTILWISLTIGLILGTILTFSFLTRLSFEKAMLFFHFFPTFLTTEAAIMAIMLAFIFYTCRNHIVILCIVYIGISLLFGLADGFNYRHDYQLFMILATPVFLLYNGNRGKIGKYAFYFFYPLHIYFLYGLSILVVLS